MKVLREIKPSIWLSKEAIDLSDNLMMRLQIQQGSTLSNLLGVNSIFYNDEAVKVWVQRELNEGLPINNKTLTILESKFLKIMNAHNILYSMDRIYGIEGGAL